MKKLPSILLIPLLAGCIEVDDLGTFWDRDESDERIQGSWRAADGFECHFSPVSSGLLFREVWPTNIIALASTDLAGQKQLSSRMYDPRAGRQARTFVYKGRSFLMSRSGTGPSDLRSYTVSSNRLVFLNFRDTILEKGIRQGHVKGSIPQRNPYDPEKGSVPHPLSAFEACRITTLTSNALDFLCAQENENYWTENRAYLRVVEK